MCLQVPTEQNACPFFRRDSLPPCLCRCVSSEFGLVTIRLGAPKILPDGNMDCTPFVALFQPTVPALRGPLFPLFWLSLGMVLDLCFLQQELPGANPDADLASFHRSLCRYIVDPAAKAMAAQQKCLRPLDEVVLDDKTALHYLSLSREVTVFCILD